MAIEVKEVIENLFPGMEYKEDLTLEELKAEQGSRFIDKELHKSTIDTAVGRYMDDTDRKFKQLLNKLGVPQTETNGKRFADLVTIGNDFSEKLSEQLEALRANGGTDTAAGKKKEAELEKKIADMETIFATKDSELQRLMAENEELKSSWAKKEESIYLNQRIEKQFAEANWTADSKEDEIVRNGFWATRIEGKYIFKPDTKPGSDEVLVFDNDEDQTIVMAGTSQMTFRKLMERELKATKRFAENKGSQQPLKPSDPKNTGGKEKSAKQLEYEQKTLARYEKR